jgi:hypothetical protein
MKGEILAYLSMHGASYACFGDLALEVASTRLAAGRIARSYLRNLWLTFVRLRILFHFVYCAAWRVFVKFMM